MTVDDGQRLTAPMQRNEMLGEGQTYPVDSQRPSADT